MHFGKAHRSTDIKETKKKKKTFIPPPRLPPAADTHQGQPQITQRVLSKLSRQRSGLPPRHAHPHQLSSKAARVPSGEKPRKQRFLFAFSNPWRKEENIRVPPSLVWFPAATIPPLQSLVPTGRSVKYHQSTTRRWHKQKWLPQDKLKALPRRKTHLLRGSQPCPFSQEEFLNLQALSCRH